MTDDLIERLRAEEDLCRNDGADDIAELLDEAAARIATQQEAIDELVAALAGIVEHFHRRSDGRPNAPDHGHDKPGIWDADNAPEIAGKPCDWCAHWANSLALLSKHGERT